MEEEISLVELFDILKKRLGMIVSFALVGVILSAIFTFFVVTPKYSARTQLLVSRTQSNEIVQQTDINTNLQLINTYKDIIKGPVILDDVREKLDVEMSHQALSDKVNIETKNDSQVFSLSITGENPYDAAVLANTIAETFRNKIGDLMKVDNVSIISEAVPNLTPVSPNQKLNLVIGLMLGAMLGIGLSFVLEFLDNTVKDDRFITEELGWTNLGYIHEISSEEIVKKQNISSTEASKHRIKRSRV